MHRRAFSDAGELSSPRSSRAASFSSDRPSVAGSVTFQMPSSIRPPPAYIAASVASQIVTDHHNAQLREDRDSDNETAPADELTNALFSEQALNLLNAFLDHLLFAFLSTAQSPSLTCIRPAISDVLKPRLAREALATADEELQGLLAGDDEEFPAHNGQAIQKWDVERVWKRTRLRIMVYTRLGELEDEDEERYVQQERELAMDDSDDDEAYLVSWASAIFLTSVIEYIAEQTLLVSGQAAFARMSGKLKKAAQMSEDGEEHQLERIVVEDYDVEKVALSSALGRLWRTWRKRVRTPLIPLSPSRGPRSMRSMSSLASFHYRRISHDAIDDSVMGGDSAPEVSEHKPTETEIAANIPLPMRDNDIDEIEVPGLAPPYEEDDSSGNRTPVLRPQRPSSVIMLAPAESFRIRIAKERPISMPPPKAGPFVVPGQPDTTDIAEATEATTTTDAEEMAFVTPMERLSDDESYIADERQEGIHHNEEDDGEAEADADMVAFAASTGMGFGMVPVSPTKSNLDKEDDDTIDTPVQTGYAEPQVLQSKRLSMERTGPPEIVRTFSTRSSRSSHRQTPEIQQDARSYLDDTHSDDDENPEAIGIAHTSNVPIRATPSPPAELPAEGSSSGYVTQKQPDHQGFVELAPRHVVAASIPTTARKTSSPEQRPAPSERPIQSEEVPREKPIQRKVTPPKSRTPPLASLQEIESWAADTQENDAPKPQTREPRLNSPTNGSPRPGGPARVKESTVPIPERSIKRKSVEGSPHPAPESVIPERSTPKRVSSSSSTTKSVGTSILHTSRDSDSSINRPRGLSGRMSEEDRQREFDSLVKGHETVKFTLTPQNMRDINEPPAARNHEPPKTHTPSSSVTVYPRVNADRDNQFGSPPMPTRTASRSKGPTPSSSRSASLKKSVGPKPLAREPRIQSESMRDFADFIRTTGPAASEDDSVQPVSLAGANGRSPNGSSTAVAGLGRKLSMKQGPSHSQSNSIVGDGLSAKPRTHMEPRSPAGQRGGNDDLIDFIRQGPPSSNNGQHRIPRSVAPFRTTVDSDQFERMLDENGNFESAYGSQVSTGSKQSNFTSNSRTGLLPDAHVVQPAYSNQPQKLSGSMSNSEPQIQRKQRRVKDPYAIDLSDEEEDDEDRLTALPNNSGGGRQKEESLMDFLNSMEPPSNSEPKPFNLSPATIAAAKARAANSSSNFSLPGTSSSATATKNGAAPRSNKPAATRSPTVSTSIASDAPRAYKPRLQARAAGARDARTDRSATSDLADFLRTSGPPPQPSAPPPGPTARKEETRRIGARFWRKKTYPDMP